MEQSFLVKQQTRDVTFKAAAYDYFTFTDLGKLDGYTRILSQCVIKGSDATYLVQISSYFMDGYTHIDFRNYASAQASVTLDVTVLYISDMYSLY